MPVKFINPEQANPFSLPIMDVSEISRKWLNVDYTPSNPHPARLLDIYLPESGDGPFPTIIAIHGGAFSAGTKDDAQVAAYMSGLDEGFAVVSVEQRLCNALADGTHNPEGIFPNPVYDFTAAIRFLRANADKYSLDSSRFATAGGSAGGYHAIMAALVADMPSMYDATLGWADISGKVHAVVDWFGVGDMIVQADFTDNNPMKLPDGTEFRMPNYADIFMGVKCDKHPNLVRFASPEIYVHSDMPPVLLQHGIADEIVPIECSRRLYRRIVEVCGEDRVDFDEFEGYTHGDARFNDPDNVRRMLDWLKLKLN